MLKLFEPEEMKTGRGGGKRGSGEKYGKYKSAIAPQLEFLKEGIAANKDKTIRVRVEDLAKEMNMAGRHETSIYWGLKYVLFQEGIVVTTGQTKADEPILIMRAKKEGDVLPDSLTRHMEKEKVPPEEEKTPGEDEKTPGEDEKTPPEE